MRPRSGIACLVVTCALAIGCGAGPELRFDEEDASGADASGDASGGVDTGGAVDASRVDTAPTAADTGASDTASPALACPASPPPPGVDACCGATACIDRQNNNSCAQCGDCTQLGCKATEVCCYSMNNGNLGCKKSAADCK